MIFYIVEPEKVRFDSDGSSIQRRNTNVLQAQSEFADEWRLTRGKTETIIGAIKLQKLLHKIAIFLQKMNWMEF
jgi:hypothetical protein